MDVPHIAVCVCTYRRPRLLRHTLESLGNLNTHRAFTYSVVVADNDREETARSAVEEFAVAAPVPVAYCVEPEQNISLARNRSLQAAQGDFVAWIDDDEFASAGWLFLLLDALRRYGADGVLGPVQPVFQTPPPAWILDGRFFVKPRRTTGLVLTWQQTSTANVLVSRELFRNMAEPFRREFGSGCEDLDFFRRAMAHGHRFVWCDEAIVSEIVPPTRWSRRYLLRRALLRGRNGAGFANAFETAKSIVAVPLYLLLLPFLLLVGQHLFVKFVMKLGDHAGRLMGLLGLRVLGEKYLVG